MSFRSLLNKRCDIEQVSNSQDDYGTPVETWTKRHDQLACRVVPLTGTEQAIFDRDSVRSTHKIFTQYKSGIITADRVLFDSDYYQIHLVRNPGNINHHLELECELIA